MKLPDGWKYIKLSELFDEVSEKNHSDTEVLTIVQGVGTVPRKDSGRDIIYDKNSLSNYKYVQKDDFIIHLRSFEGGLESANQEGIVSPAYIILHLKIQAEPGYLYALFHSNRFINQTMAPAVEGVRDGRTVKYEVLKNQSIPFPPLAEQQKIAEILCKQDKMISLKQKLMEQKLQQKKWLMKKLLEIPHTNADCEEKISLGGVVIDKSGWKKERLGRICTITGRIGFRGYTRDDITSSDKGVLSLSPSNIIDGQLNMEDSTFITLEKYLESPEIMIQKHDIVFVKTGSTFGKVGYLDTIYQKATINPQLVIIRSNNLVRQNLLYYILKSNYFQNFVNMIVVGGAVPTLSQEQLSKIMIYLPSLPEQKIIAQVLSAADKEIALIKSSIEQEKQKKKSLAQLLLTGTVRVKT